MICFIFRADVSNELDVFSLLLVLPLGDAKNIEAPVN